MKRYIKERIERNKALAAEDAKHRCGQCKIALPAGTKVFLIWGNPLMFCSDICAQDYTDAAQTRPAKVGRR